MCVVGGGVGGGGGGGAESAHAEFKYRYLNNGYSYHSNNSRLFLEIHVSKGRRNGENIG